MSNELYAEGAAGNILARIETSILRLRDFPFSGSYVADEFLKKKGYRKLIIDSYIALYLVDEQEKQLVVMRVLYGKQKYQDLL
ncbi:type II toxin-antitoxin system RelE/ParE family toxin [Peptococcaceae bacterium 1198_IL3148]